MNAGRDAGRGGPDELHLLGLLGHELRSPLHALRANVELLASYCHGEEQGHPILERMRHGVDYLASLADELRDLTRPLEPRPARSVSLGKIVERAIELCRHAFDERGQRLRVILPPPSTGVLVDSLHIEQVLVNLLNNAARYTARGGTIEVRAAEEPAGEAKVEVADTGRGIAEDELDAIFQPFFRGAEARADAPEGMGLGLWLSRQLAALYGGRLSAESAGVGQGSRFTLRLPLARAGAEESEAAKPQPPAASSRRVLLVEDDPSGDALAELLALRGHRVQRVGTVAEASAACRRGRPEAILLDLALPDGSGLELAERLRGEGLLDGVDLIVVTGSTDEPSRRRSFELGCRAYLVKPVDIDALLGALAGASAPPAR